MIKLLKNRAEQSERRVEVGVRESSLALQSTILTTCHPTRRLATLIVLCLRN